MKDQELQGILLFLAGLAGREAPAVSLPDNWTRLSMRQAESCAGSIQGANARPGFFSDGKP